MNRFKRLILDDRQGEEIAGNRSFEQFAKKAMMVNFQLAVVGALVWIASLTASFLGGGHWRCPARAVDLVHRRQFELRVFDELCL